MSSEYLCNLVIPGAAKSGTSSLHEYLGAHPMISASSSKEPHHFSRDSRYSMGPEPHNILFKRKPNARYFFESSTTYLPWRTAAERIARDLERPKAILLLRHPVSRCFSHYRWRYRLGLERRSFLDAIKNDGFGFDPEKPDRFGFKAYLELSKYAQQGSMWESILGAENCLFVASEDLKGDQQKTLERCFSFLDIPPVTVSDGCEKFNETAALTRQPSKKMTRIASFLPHDYKSSLLYRKIRHKILKISSPKPPADMTDEERSFVEEVLAEDISWYLSRFPNLTNTHREL